jgi:hypothetical protein
MVAVPPPSAVWQPALMSLPHQWRKKMVKFAIVITLGLVAGQAFAQQPVELTPNQRVQQAFKALEEQQTATFKAFSGPFMQAYGDTSQFACTAVGPEGWCMNPFGAMAKE